jgi:hypothetical protein
MTQVVSWFKAALGFVTGLINLIASYYPSALPTGMSQFTSWADSILAMSKVPNNDSTHFTLATMILHLDSTSDCKAKRFFVKALNKGAANQVAAETFNQLKAKQVAASKAAAEATAQAAGIGNTTPTLAASGGQTQIQQPQS